MTPLRLTRREKVELIALARRVFPDLTHRQRAALLGMSYGAYWNLLNDPDGAKQKARREKYKGVCERCGAETRSDGTSRPSRLCVVCATPEKFWTRERIIDAIQRFAATNGRPPTAAEWIRADRENGYPPRSVVYRQPSCKTAPFASWADAIKAAGFTRPRIGKRQDDLTPNLARTVLRELRQAEQPFRFREAVALIVKHRGVDRRTAKGRASTYLGWWCRQGYLVRRAPGLYAVTGKRYRDEVAA